ncbi:MAG TPA: hypothetical protein VF185_00860 [Patescibacteria group bacterium]
MKSKQLQYGFSFAVVLLIVLIILLAGVIYYLFSLNSNAYSEYSNQITQDSSVNLNNVYYNTSDYPEIANWNITFVYPSKVKDRGNIHSYQNLNEIDVVGENNVQLVNIYSQPSNYDLETWWEGLPQNETKKIYASYRPNLFGKIKDVEVTFRGGTEWEEQKEILVAKNGRNYIFRLNHAICSGCWQTPVEEAIYNSLKIN